MSRSDRRHRQQATVGQSRTGRTVALLLLSGILSAAATPVATLAQSAPVERPAPADPYAAHIAEASPRSAVPVAWLRAVLRVQSAGRVLTISSAGAQGLLQVIPGTRAELPPR